MSKSDGYAVFSKSSESHGLFWICKNIVFIKSPLIYEFWLALVNLKNMSLEQISQNEKKCETDGVVLVLQMWK